MLIVGVKIRRGKRQLSREKRMCYSIHTDQYQYLEWYERNHKLGKRNAFQDAKLLDTFNDPMEKVSMITID